MVDKKEDDEHDAEGAPGEGGDAGDDAAAAKKKKKRKLMMMVAAGVVLLGAGGGGFAYYKGMFASKAPVEVVGKKGKKAKKEGEHEGGEGGEGHGTSVKAAKHNPNEWVPGVVPGHDGEDSVFYNLPEFLANLDTNSKQTTFIKMKVTLEASSEGDNMDAVDNRLPRIIDKFNTYLRTLRISDIAGSAGQYRLKEELLLQVNKEIYPSKVNDILFQEIIIQ